MSHPLTIVPAPIAVDEPVVTGRRAVRSSGSLITVLCDATGAAVAAEMPAEVYHRMSAVLRGDVDGRPHILTWCSRHGRVEIPAILLDPTATLDPARPAPEAPGGALLAA